MSHKQDGFGNYSEKLRAMMSQRASRLGVDLNDLREYDSSFADAATSGQDNIADRYDVMDGWLHYVLRYRLLTALVYACATASCATRWSTCRRSRPP